ncbi:MAG TPA: glycosyl transferase [Beijerinckiaceae bacterium]|jgi:UDP-N-acetylmuramyl pentapeptide phosphotransferase/UDP-N-acetylglucosamine-1-phosphate transferase
MVHATILVLACAASALLCAGLIVILRPLLQRYALARPNARSSHRVPTPQGGGIAVIGATILVVGLVLALGGPGSLRELGVVALAAAALAVVGAVDDIRPLSPALRLVLQTVAVAAAVTVAGDRIAPEAVPRPVEWAFLVLAGVWFVNLVNFMDGLDWITVAEIVPVTAAVALIAPIAGLPDGVALVAAALLGGLMGFAPFNRPVARLFLGDVGSLPIGLLTGWLLLKLAGTGALAAAILLPLYHLLDATLTLLRRLTRGERVWEAHRSHLYQRATDNGFTVIEVVTRVFLLNLALAALAALTVAWPAWPVQAGALGAGLLLTGLTLNAFARRRGS